MVRNQTCWCFGLTRVETGLRQIFYFRLSASRPPHGMVWSKTYNGVALLFKDEASDVLRGMPDYKDEPEHIITATINGIRIINVYSASG